MRKLARTEIAAMVSALTLATSASADEPITNLPTVTVTGTYNPAPRYGYAPGAYITHLTTPQYQGNNSSSGTGRNFHALMCAFAYGQSNYKGAKPGFTTYFVENYGWRNQANPPAVRGTPTNVSPGPGWTPTNGATDRRGSGKSHVFKLSVPNMVDFIGTLAHEYAHQWGATEAQADAAEAHARNAYLDDEGKKCGGLMQ
jgi:hypothetical protein